MGRTEARAVVARAVRIVRVLLVAPGQSVRAMMVALVPQLNHGVLPVVVVQRLLVQTLQAVRAAMVAMGHHRQ